MRNYHNNNNNNNNDDFNEIHNHNEGHSSFGVVSSNREWEDAQATRRVQPRAQRVTVDNNAPNDSDSSVIMSVAARGQRYGTVGVALMESVHPGDIYMLEFLYDEKDGGALLRQLKEEWIPAQILLPKGMEENIVKALSEPVDGHSVDTDCLITMLPKNDFLFPTGKQRILSLPLERAPPTDRELFVSSLVDFGKQEMIRAAGALLGHVGLNTLENAPSIRLHEISASSLLRIDANVLQSLQIFRHEYHPSAAGIGGSKEGFSLFNLVNRAKSVGGRQLLKQWMMRPLRDLPLLQERQDHVMALRDPRCDGVVKQSFGVLGSVKDMRRICARIASLQSSWSDWLALRNSISACLELRDFTRAMASETELRVLTQLQRCMDKSTLPQLLLVLDQVIDIDESRKSRRLTLQIGVDPGLDELKTDYEGLQNILQRIADEQVHALPPHLGLSLTTVYFPMIGYVVVVSRRPNEAVSQQVAALPSSFEYLFDTDTFIYYKTDLTKQLDEQLGDIHSRIVDRENEIIRELETHILKQVQHLREAGEIAAELDCLITFALVANDLNWVKPKLVPDAGTLYITGGRHPLQQLCVETFIPNDTSICAGREGTVQLITGPNASGKSVYLKQVGLIAYLAHIGACVPAEAAVVGLMDGIFARIASRESSSVANSSFFLDLTQVSTMLRHASPRSLLLIDEFGKGTDPLDGAALLGACLEHIVDSHAMCVVTTHFGELLAPGVLRANLGGLQLLNMSFVLNPGASAETSLLWLFKLTPGSCVSSFGDVCARVAQIPSQILDRATEITHQISSGKQISRLESRANISKTQSFKEIYNLLMNFDVDSGDMQSFLHQLSQFQTEM